MPREPQINYATEYPETFWEEIYVEYKFTKPPYVEKKWTPRQRDWVAECQFNEQMALRNEEMDEGIKWNKHINNAIYGTWPDFEHMDKKPEPIIGLETGNMDRKYGGVISWREDKDGNHIDQNGNIISTRESRAKEDVPQWKKFELGRLEIVDRVVVPGPNALEKDIAQYGENVKLTGRYKVEQRQKDAQKKAGTPVQDKIMPNDPNHTPLEKALNWAAESHHGEDHQVRWGRVAAALGSGDKHFNPMSYEVLLRQWERFARNPRWTMAKEAFEAAGLDKQAPPKIPQKDTPNAAPDPYPTIKDPRTGFTFKVPVAMQDDIDEIVYYVTEDDRGVRSLILSFSTTKGASGNTNLGRVDENTPLGMVDYDALPTLKTGQVFNQIAVATGEPETVKIDVPSDMAAAIEAEDWELVAQLAKQRKVEV